MIIYPMAKIIFRNPTGKGLFLAVFFGRFSFNWDNCYCSKTISVNKSSTRPILEIFQYFSYLTYIYCTDTKRLALSPWLAKWVKMADVASIPSSVWSYFIFSFAYFTEIWKKSILDPTLARVVRYGPLSCELSYWYLYFCA